MDDPPSGSTHPSWLERISSLLLREPGDRQELVTLLHSAFDRNLLDSDALSMIEGVIQVSEMQARDIMVPRSQMVVINITETPDQFIPLAISTAHSRFPVIDADKNNVVGILLAKDLLRYYASTDKFDLRKMLRPVVFIPESKRLNILLRDFRNNRNHMAIVVDEYGGVAGLVTIENVLEQIVGEIEDEYDFDESGDNIVETPEGHYRIKAHTEIADLNEALSMEFSDEDYDTIGGLILSHFGRLPKRGETIEIDGLQFTVAHADSRRIYTLLVAPTTDND